MRITEQMVRCDLIDRLREDLIDRQGRLLNFPLLGGRVGWLVLPADMTQEDIAFLRRWLNIVEQTHHFPSRAPIGENEEMQPAFKQEGEADA